MAICESVIKGNPSYSWVRFVYIDDPISSLDDQNAIAVAEDLGGLIKEAKEAKRTSGRDALQFVISSHHGLFFNVICNVTKKLNTKRYFMHRKENGESLSLRPTDETPFFQHLATLAELKSLSENSKLCKHHFNALRGLLEKTACFFGYENPEDCFEDPIKGKEHLRTLNVHSHDRYSLFQPEMMSTKDHTDFQEILSAFCESVPFKLPSI
jgi:wobble nucleotide-excising tRNase